MADAHFDQMTYLMGFIFILMLVIFGTIVFSQISKRKKPADKKVEAQTVAQVEPRVLKQKSEIETGLPFQNVKTIDIPVAAEPVIEEKEITVAEALAKTEESFFGRIKKAFSNADKLKVIDEIEEIFQKFGLKSASRPLAA